MNKLSLLLWLSLNSCAFADTVWVERESYHTALLVPTSVVIAQIPALQGVIGNETYTRFGWGNQDYYGSSQKSIGKAMKALFIPSASVVEIAGFAEPAEAGAKVLAVEVSKEEVQRLLGFISVTFKFDSESKPILVRTEPTGFRYYSAMGRYHLFRNCNNWTAEGLKHSGKNVYFRWSFLAGQVMGQMIICPYMRFQICRNNPLTPAPPKRIPLSIDEILVQQNHALRCVRSAFYFYFNTLPKI